MLKKITVLAVLLVLAFGVMMLTTRSSSFVVVNSLGIGHPSEKIWLVLTNVEDWPRWWPGVQEARLPQGWQKGALFHLILKGTPEKDQARIVAVEPNKELVWARSGVLGSSSRTSLRLVRMSGGTEVFLESSITGPQAFLARITGKDEFGRYHDKVLEALKAYMDNPPGTEGAAGEQP